MNCEFCEKPPEWRYWHGSYERFGCSDHIGWMRRLIKLDLGPVPYQFEPITRSSQGWVQPSDQENGT